MTIRISLIHYDRPPVIVYKSNRKTDLKIDMMSLYI